MIRFSGLGQTAARLQRDWGQPNPEALPFAGSIRPHALVVLLQKGLRLHEYESSIDQARFCALSHQSEDLGFGSNRRQNGNRKSPVPFFGAQGAINPLAVKKAEDDGSSSPSQRPPYEPLVNGLSHDGSSQAPPAKRSRRNGGLTAGAGKSRGGDAMDVDQHPNGVLHPNEATTKREPMASPTAAPAAPGGRTETHEMDLDAEPSNSKRPTSDPEPSARPGADRPPTTNGETYLPNHHHPHHQHFDASNHVDQAPPAPPVVATLTNGHSVGVQSDKVADRGLATRGLDAPGRDVTQVRWNPHDPTLLAAGGDALCRIWTVPTGSALAPDPAVASSPGAAGPLTPGSLQPPLSAGEDAAAGAVAATVSMARSLDLPVVVSDGAEVTAMAWSPDGQKLALALHPKTAVARGTVVILSKSGEILDELPGAQDWLLQLAWSPSGTFLLGVLHVPQDPSQAGSVSLLEVWDLAQNRDVEGARLSHTVHEAAWIDDQHFAAVGPGVLYKITIEERPTSLVLVDADPWLTEHAWAHVVVDPVLYKAFVATEATGRLALWNLAGNLVDVERAHEASITAMVYQPLANPAAQNDDTPRLLATASTDGSVALWDAVTDGRLYRVRSVSLGTDEPALALSFSPDGYLLAAAGPRKAMIWQTEEGSPPRTTPRAVWQGVGSTWRYASDNGKVFRVNGNAKGSLEDTEMGEDSDVAPRSLSWDAEGKRLALGALDQASFNIPLLRCAI